MAIKQGQTIIRNSIQFSNFNSSQKRISFLDSATHSSNRLKENRISKIK